MGLFYRLSSKGECALVVNCGGWNPAENAAGFRNAPLVPLIRVYQVEERISFVYFESFVRPFDRVKYIENGIRTPFVDFTAVVRAFHGVEDVKIAFSAPFVYDPFVVVGLDGVQHIEYGSPSPVVDFVCAVRHLHNAVYVAEQFLIPGGDVFSVVLHRGGKSEQREQSEEKVFFHGNGYCIRTNIRFYDILHS